MKIIEIPEFRPRWEIATCGADTTVAEAARLMAARNIGAVPVVDEDRLLGIFSERDLLKRVVAADKPPETTRVSDVMTTDLVTAQATDSVSQVTKMMLTGKFRHIPVVDADNDLTGILSLRDFMAVTWLQLFERTGRHTLLGLTGLWRRKEGARGR